MCVCRDRDRSRSAADEWEISTAAERHCNELSGSLCAADRIQVKKMCCKISYLCSPFWCYDLFQYGRKIGEELELIFQRRKKKNLFYSSEPQLLSKSCTGIKWKIWEFVAVVWACISRQTPAQASTRWNNSCLVIHPWNDNWESARIRRMWRSYHLCRCLSL